MKKNYILPEIELLCVTSADVITTSPTGIGDNENDILVSVTDW